LKICKFTLPCTAVNPGDENDLDDVEEMSMEPVQKRLRLEDMGEGTDDHIIQHVTTIEVCRQNGNIYVVNCNVYVTVILS